MAIVVLDEVQQWLETTKMSLASLDTQLADSASAIAFSSVAGVYNTTVWTTPTNTPKLVRSAISMLIAAWEYQRAYSEEDASNYGVALEEKALGLLSGIGDGDIILPEYPDIGAAIGTPDFFPNDSSNTADVYDAMGFLVSHGDDVKFRMSGIY